ncbi:MAG TPA: CCA tRNA nucleotidyltransferase [Methanocorpusculum sp.]|nr:CCA tRNA nucleotidyltransferase [Methanocorpusculum sp.]
MRNTFETEILKRVLPSSEDVRKTEEMGARLIDAVYEVAQVPAMMTGSVARGTWVKGDKDIDIFMLFSPELDRESLQELGLKAAYAVVEKFHGTAAEKYAEHPYLNAVIDGYDVDLVPCYHVASTAEMKCAVDRTPFHTRYLKDKIAPLREDVLLLKQFCKAGGVYGSDHMTGGFSGYLCELLTLYYGGFSQVISAAVLAFRPKMVIDIEGYYSDKKTPAKLFNEPLIVIDPTDKTRNVAAAVTMTKYAEFCELARAYQQHPGMQFFEIPASKMIGRDEFVGTLQDRGTAMVALTFKTPDLVPDTIVPQLKKSVESLRSMLEEVDFSVIRCGYFMGPIESMLLLELSSLNLPACMIREGPPVWNPENAAKFVEKYGKTASPLAGPWIQDGRWYTEIPRKYRSAVSLLEDSAKVFSGALGKHIRLSMEDGYKVLVNEEIWSEPVAEFLYRYLSNRSSVILKKNEC